MATPAATNKHHRGFSFTSKSSKSRRSHRSSAASVPVSESAEEKVRHSLQSKANPTMALSELQPMAAALEKSNLANIREMQHKDQHGNVITDPDLSNPTRPRMERPLDTIRSFDAAMYGAPTASRPVSFVKSRESLITRHIEVQQLTDVLADDPSPAGDYSRRTSYFGANEYSRYGPSRHNSYGYGENYNHPPENYYPYNQASRSRPRPSRRMTSDHSMHGNPPRNANAYAQQGYQKSYDNITAASGSGSGQTDPYGNSTDPSSINSSFDRLQQQQQQQQFQQQQQDKGYDHGQAYGQPSNFYDAPEAPASSPARHVFGTAPASDPNSGGPVGGAQAAALGNRRHLRKSTNASEIGEGKENKRKSWFKRKFSKS